MQHLCSMLPGQKQIRFHVRGYFCATRTTLRFQHCVSGRHAHIGRSQNPVQIACWGGGAHNWGVFISSTRLETLLTLPIV